MVREMLLKTRASPNSTLQPWRTARLTRDLVDVLAGRRAAPEPAPVLTLFKKEERARIAGTWRSAVLGKVLIDVQGGRPFVRVNGGELGVPAARWRVLRANV